ncbi:hypothetical protein QQY66_01295 [Streptomyces sp. DG2A-72]|uniref:hypothetical protein n=1 Tax=Streptomyces sp. DG2A-72 TaxID=3051386 RepID=UPI00265BC5F8|nr:hypothetical protein [Streptomyces sp. DG2A-72]MDO0930397.1 hypothetical protein [Streptomyces sp. DG2A-72]
MKPIRIRIRIGRGGNGRLSARILANHLFILALTGVIGFVLFAIAQTTAVEPQIQQVMEYGGGGDVVQAVAERIRKASGASYVVVTDVRGIRHSHPIPSLIGKPVSDPLAVRDGRTHVGVDHGVTGQSANGQAPLYGPTGALVGEVSAGIPEHDVLGELWRELPTFGLYAAIATALGSAAAFLLARRITVVNDEARHLLALGTAIGSRLEDILPDARLRRAADGTLTGTDVSVLTDDHCLVVNRMPVALRGRELGAVVTVRDRTELIGLLRELDSVRGLTNALRAQQHEFTVPDTARTPQGALFTTAPPLSAGAEGGDRW